MRRTVSNLLVCGLVATFSFSLAACSKQQSASEAASARMQADKAMAGGAMPAAAPAAPPAEMAADAASASFEGAADAVAKGNVAEEVARREAEDPVETTTRVDAAQVSSSASTYKDGERKFIRTAQAQFRVKDVYGSSLAIEDVAAQQGGFVVDNGITADTTRIERRPAGNGKLLELAEYQVRGNLTVRVPSDNTQAFLRAIASQMEFLDRRSFQAADAQFDLLRQQLARQREEEAQRELGDAIRGGDRLDRKADVISARNDARAQRDEALIQQKQYLDRVDFSTITLTLYQAPKLRQTELVDTDAVFRQHAQGFFSRMFDALRTGWYGILDLVVALTAAWPLWLMIGLVVYGIRRWRAARPTKRPPPIE
jgi:hypothetical protein